MLDAVEPGRVRDDELVDRPPAARPVESLNDHDLLDRRAATGEGEQDALGRQAGVGGAERARRVKRPRGRRHLGQEAAQELGVAVVGEFLDDMARRIVAQRIDHAGSDQAIAVVKAALLGDEFDDREMRQDILDLAGIEIRRSGAGRPAAFSSQYS